MNSKAYWSLKRWREEELILTQRQLAQVGRVSQGSLSKIEGGHMPRYNHLDKFSKVYSLTIPEFKRLVKCSAAQLAPVPTPAESISQELPLWELAGVNPNGEKIEPQSAQRSQRTATAKWGVA